MGDRGRRDLTCHKTYAQEVLKLQLIYILLKYVLSVVLGDERTFRLQIICFRAELSDKRV